MVAPITAARPVQSIGTLRVLQIVVASMQALTAKVPVDGVLTMIPD